MASVANVINLVLSKVFVYEIKLDKNKSLEAPLGVSLAIDHITTLALLISLNIISVN